MHTDTDTQCNSCGSNNCSNSLFCATCKMQLKTNFTSFQIADGAHKQSIRRNQHQSRLKHLSQSGTRQVKAQLTAQLSAQLRFSSVQRSCCQQLPLFVCHIIQSSAKSTPTRPAAFTPPQRPPPWGNCICLPSQSVSESDAQQTQPLAVARNAQRVTSIHSIHSALFTIHCSRTSHDAVAGSQIK